MNYYDLGQIKAASNCLQYATQILGLVPVNSHGRFNSPLRAGSDSGSFQISDDGWYDHVAKYGGTIVDLVMIMRGCGLQPAQEELGAYYNLTPVKTEKRKPYHSPKGWAQVAVYQYNQYVQKVRYEKDGKKRFQWRHAFDGKWWYGRTGLKVLYGWAPGFKYAIIFEGEKDRDAARLAGINAISPPDGAGSWDESFTPLFVNMKVGIVSDTDDVGRAHADDVAQALAGTALEIKIIEMGDPADFFQQNPAGVLFEMFKVQGPYVYREDLVASAKKANVLAFSNYITKKDDKGNSYKIPMKVLDVVGSVHTRCMGFPKCIGETLFDHERTDADDEMNTGKIRFLGRTASLLAWIGEKTSHPVKWSRQGEGMLTQDQMYESLLANSDRFEGIYSTPTWPTRDDVYYTHGPLPEADPGMMRFEHLVNFFKPATNEDKTLLRCLLAAPLYYRHGIDRPLWIIDSTTGPRSGKTTLATLLGYLHGTTIANQQPIMVQQETLRNNGEEITKRVISAGGREKKVLLVDNITGRFSCPELAAMITIPGISGRAPYGRGEETRPNDLTYIITANTAQIDTDIATRAFWIILERPNDDAGWKESVMEYIDENRLEILVDAIAFLKAGPQFDLERSQMTTRFPAFEYDVLAPMAGDLESYNAAIKYLIDRSHDANQEADEAARITEILRERIQGMSIDPDDKAIFIKSQIIEDWVHDAWKDFRGNVMQSVKNHAKTGQIPNIDPKIMRYPYTKNRKSGVMWIGSDPAGIPYDDRGRPSPTFVIEMMQGKPKATTVI